MKYYMVTIDEEQDHGHFGAPGTWFGTRSFQIGGKLPISTRLNPRTRKPTYKRQKSGPETRCDAHCVYDPWV